MIYDCRSKRVLVVCFLARYLFQYDRNSMLMCLDRITMLSQRAGSWSFYNLLASIVISISSQNAPTLYPPPF